MDIWLWGKGQGTTPYKVGWMTHEKGCNIIQNKGGI